MDESVISQINIRPKTSYQVADSMADDSLLFSAIEEDKLEFPATLLPSRPADILSESNNYLEKVASKAKFDEVIQHTGSKTKSSNISFQCEYIRIDILSTWGDPSYVGLSGIQILVGPNFDLLPLGPDSIDANPRDLSAVGCFDDPRVVDNLLTDINDTSSDEGMWLIPFTKGSAHYIQIDLLKMTEVTGIRFYYSIIIINININMTEFGIIISL